MEELIQLIFRLCQAPGGSGEEFPASQAALQELAPLAETEMDNLGNVYAHLGKKDAKEHILLDAHIDQIGMVVTGVDENGFLQASSCGGIDKRQILGSSVVVHGKKLLAGIVCCTPPHLQKGEEKLPALDELSIDVGLSRDEVKKIVAPGDRIFSWSKPRRLLGNRIACAALDNRASCAVLVRCAQLLQGEELDCRVTILLSGGEEVTGLGAATGARRVMPTQAIVADVGFGAQPGVSQRVGQPLGAGPAIGFAPILDREMSLEFCRLADSLSIPWKEDVYGGGTGTNSEGIASTGAGVRTGMFSVPIRYMHSAVETLDAQDVENTARLIAAYVKGVRSCG